MHYSSMRRDPVGVAVLWAVLTAIALVVVTSVDVLPAVRSDKGELIDDAFRVLLILGTPVFTFVVAVVVYSVVRFRRTGEPTEDGPPLLGRGPVPRAWVVITTALAVLVMIYPGMSELPKVIAVDPAPALVVRVEGFRWAWRVTYPDRGVVSMTEMVLPVGRAVRFDVTSTDVLHSFWVPAFRMKIDAVPGLTTRISLTPTEEGTYEADHTLRLQCAELCGIAHARMMMPVRVVSTEEFEAWLASQPPASPPASPAP